MTDHADRSRQLEIEELEARPDASLGRAQVEVRNGVIPCIVATAATVRALNLIAG